jgi:hypothetical protein
MATSPQKAKTIGFEPLTDHNESAKTLKKQAGVRRGEMQKKARDDLEYQDYLLMTFREVSKKSLIELRKEELSLGFAKIVECRLELT